MNEERTQAYLKFLMEVLRKVKDEPSQESFYSFLEERLNQLDEQLDENFRKTLENWTRDALSKYNSEISYHIAIDIVNLSILIQDFYHGNIATNLEIAITGYQIALTIFNVDASREQWATTQNSIGLAYSNRIIVVRAENLEKAIACYQEALEVRTFDAFPVDWAGTQHNLGNAYIVRIRGDKAENLEKAIACYQEALEVRTFDAFPVDWAMTQNNLAAAYSDRITGERSENLERAIASKLVETRRT